MKLFLDCFKDATAQSGHVMTALGNENYRFGRFRSQPNRRSQKEFDRKRGAENEEMSDLSQASYMKDPDLSLNEEMEGDIVRAATRKWVLPLSIKKSQPDKRLIFGWASVVEKDGVAVIDKQGDIIPVEELENAAYEFAINSREGGDMHSRTGVAKLVESMVFTRDKQEVLGVNLGQIGWWVGFKVHDDELWAAHRRGERPEFSIGGAAIPIEVEG